MPPLHGSHTQILPSPSTAKLMGFSSSPGAVPLREMRARNSPDWSYTIMHAALRSRTIISPLEPNAAPSMAPRT